MTTIKARIDVTCLKPVAVIRTVNTAEGAIVTIILFSQRHDLAGARAAFGRRAYLRAGARSRYPGSDWLTDLPDCPIEHEFPARDISRPHIATFVATYEGSLGAITRTYHRLCQEHGWEALSFEDYLNRCGDDSRTLDEVR
jgi:hypothetical protein